MPRVVPLPLLALLTLSAFSAGAGPSKPKPAGDLPPEETAPEETLDYTMPEEVEAAALGADFIDTNFLFTVPSPGAEWTRLTPVPNAPGLRAAFVHRRGDAVLALITVAVDANPVPKDVTGYAQMTFKTLTSPPLNFKITTKGVRTLAGKQAFTVNYTSSDKVRTYEQAYLPGASGSIVVVTLQAPAAHFERENKAFRAAVAGMKL